MGRWRSRRGWSVPCGSVIVRPQRRQQVLSSVLSTLRMNSPALVCSVWRTCRSGISSGMEMKGCLGMATNLSTNIRIAGHDATDGLPQQPLYLGPSTAKPEEPTISSTVFGIGDWRLGIALPSTQSPIPSRCAESAPGLFYDEVDYA